MGKHARFWATIAVSYWLGTALAFGQGITNLTGIESNIAISGAGYFFLLDPNTGLSLATRFGMFLIDSSGYFVSTEGYRLQGYSDATLTNLGDVRLATDSPSPQIYSYDIEGNGKIIADLSDGTQVCAGQILLQNFSNSQNLGRYINGLSIINPSARPLANPLPPGANGLGTLVPGELETPIPSVSLGAVSPAGPAITQGILYETSVPDDLSIEGNGFFVVRDTNSNTTFATRAGACYLDANGFLVNYAGMRLQGSTGDLQITQTARTVSYSVDLTGTITTEYDDGTTAAVGQILLTDCAHSNLLVRSNFNLYSMTGAAGPWSPLTPPQTGGFGFVVSGTAELSQFDQSILNVRSHLNFFLQGALESTCSASNLAINGQGFFTVRDPATGIFYATRDGEFQLDASSHLIDTNGFRVQGMNDPNLSTAGDIVIDSHGAPSLSDSNATLAAFRIDWEGNIIAKLSDGTEFERGQILLQNYANLQGLMPCAHLLYTNLVAARPEFGTSGGPPGIGNLGNVAQGYVEIPYEPPQVQLLPQTGFRVLAQNLLGSVIVQVSSDLQTWTNAGEIDGSIMADGEFYDTNTAAGPARFYRLQLQQ
jgi:flagellar hook protein FlgE